LSIAESLFLSAFPLSAAEGVAAFAGSGEEFEVTIGSAGESVKP
jgi:hypothetical protein